MAVPTRESLAWFAGLFEGEGSILTPQRDSFRLDTAGSDLDVLEHARDVLDMGNINGPYHQHGMGSKPMYYYRVGGDDAYALLVMIFPWLHNRRKSKAREALQQYADRPLTGRKALECSNGHRYTPETTYMHNGRRNCRVCRAEASRRCRQKKVNSLGRTTD